MITAVLLAPLLLCVSAAAQMEAILWREEKNIKRVKKPGRKLSRPIPAQERAPLLALKWKVLRRSEDGSAESLASTSALKTGDQLKLSITPNQDGFLYIVHSSKDLNGNLIDRPRLIFPDPRINGGKNSVRRDQEYVVPAYCPEYEDPADCWWELTPPAGREIFTLILSRDQIAALPDTATEPEQPVEQRIIDEIKRSSEQVIKKAAKAQLASRRIESDGTYVQNMNPRDNEELIETIEVAHSGEDDAGTRARAMFVKKRTDAMRIEVLQYSGNKLEPVDPGREFKRGDQIKIRFQSNFRGYVYIINVSPGGKRRLLFPYPGETRNEIEPDRIYYLPREGVIEFDEEKGVEVLQVVMSRNRIPFLDAAVDNTEGELSGSAASAAAELRGMQGGIYQTKTVALKEEETKGIRSRGVILAPGKGKNKSYYVAIPEEGGNTIKSGEMAVFEIRLKHV
jgi:hypothetical protein